MSDDHYSSNDEDDYDPTTEFQSTATADDTTTTVSQKKLFQQVQQKNSIPNNVQLFPKHEDKTASALKTYVDLEESTYANRQIGDSGQNGEYMSCVCREDFEDGINSACFHDDCINRGTKIECVNGHTSCGDDCANQRFQKKQYASINIIQTDKKGFGVRLQEEIEPDSLIYEYIGEVIDEKTFKKRMINYDKEGIKHFYFMMLQKGEFVDATKKGSLGRFLNHSCNPNCYVEKWVVADKLRMGIFSKRKILSNEELTFNYNVDRYGAKAQPCYCGESNCLGFIGGKTQTDSASLLPQYISEALGSSVELEQEFVLAKQKSGAKLEKNDNNINIEFVESLKMAPIEKFEANAVIGVLRQNDDLLIVDKLLERIELTEKLDVQEKLCWAHAHTIFRILIKNYINKDDGEEINNKKSNLITRIFKILLIWPPVSKNRIQDSKITETVQQIQSIDFNDELTKLSVDLLARWETFEEFQRIKKSDKAQNSEYKLLLDDRRRERLQNSVSASASIPTTPATPTRVSNVTYETITGVEYFEKADALRDLHPDWQVALDENQGKFYFYNNITKETGWDKLAKVQPKPAHSSSSNYVEYTDEEKEQYRKKKMEEERKKKELDLRSKKQKEENDFQAILLKATQEENRKKEDENNRQKAIDDQKRKLKEQYKAKMKKKQAAKATGSSGSSSSGSSETLEKQWKFFFAEVVPNMLKKKYMAEIGKDNVKICAKEITSQLILKELKKGKTPPTKLGSEKYVKIKELVTVYMDKFLKNYRERQKRKLDSNGNGSENGKKQHV